MPEPREYCRGCDALVERQREGEPYSCYRGGDDKPLVELKADENGHPLRSAACLADNPPLLTREQFLAAVREQCEDDELVLSAVALFSIERIRTHTDLDGRRMFLRLRDAFASIPMQPSPDGGDIAFVGEAVWGDEAIRRTEDALHATWLQADSLQSLLAGLGETEPAQTD